MERFKTGRWVASLAFAGCLALGTQARAASLTTFFGEDLVGGDSSAPKPNAKQAHDDFQSNLSGVGTEDFESASTGSFGSLTLDFGSDTATLSGNPTKIGDSTFSGRFATSGSRYVETDSRGSFTVDFSAPQAAFGFYGTDIGDIGSQLSIALSLSDGSTTTLNVPHTVDPSNGSNGSDGSVLYFGVIATQSADTFTQATFEITAATGNSTGDAFGFDDMTIGDITQVNSAPTPAAFGADLVMIGGLLGGVLVRRRRVPRV